MKQGPLNFPLILLLLAAAFLWLPIRVPATCVSLNGTNAYVSLPGINLSAGNTLTIVAWIKPNALTNTTFSEIIRQESASSFTPPPDWLISFQNNGTLLAFGLATGEYQELRVPITPADYVDGNWHHIAATYDGVTKRIYKDGIQIGSGSQSGNVAQTGGPCFVGASLRNPEYFNGLIDEVRIWRVARSANELNQFLNRSLLGTEPSLVAYWRFNEGAGSRVIDATAGNQTGGLVGAAWNGANAPLQAFNAPPIVTTAFSSNVTSNSAVLTVKTDPLGASVTAWFEYGTNLDYGSQTQPTNLGSAFEMTSLSLPISNLVAAQLYHWRPVATNNAAASLGLDRIFSTSGRRIGYSLSFNGNDSIDAGWVDLGAGATNLTLEAWIKPATLTNNCELIRAPDSWLLSFQSTGSLFTVTLITQPSGPVTVNLPIDPGDYSNGDWHHIALAYDGAWARVYKDGVEIAAWGRVIMSPAKAFAS